MAREVEQSSTSATRLFDSRSISCPGSGWLARGPALTAGELREELSDAIDNRRTGRSKG